MSIGAQGFMQFFFQVCAILETLFTTDVVNIGDDGIRTPDCLCHPPPVLGGLEFCPPVLTERCVANGNHLGSVKPGHDGASLTHPSPKKVPRPQAVHESFPSSIRD